MLCPGVGVGIRNDNDCRFVDFCSTHHLVIGGTTFQRRTYEKVSWQHPSRGDFAVALKIYVTERWPILVNLGIIT